MYRICLSAAAFIVMQRRIRRDAMKGMIIIPMRFSLKSEVQRKIFIYSSSLIIAIFAYLVFTRINDIYKFIGSVFTILLPFILGYGIAFILSGPVAWIENRLAVFPWKASRRRLLATAIVFLSAVLFVIFAMWVVIPNLFDSFRVFLANFSTYSTQTEKMVLDVAERMNLNQADIQKFFNELNLANTVNEFISNNISKAMNYSISLIQLFSNLVIAIAAAFYMLLYKENLLHAWKNILYSVVSRDKANFLTLYSIDAKNVFQQYIVGNILDSLLVGVVCWIGMLILRIPYAPMIGFIIGVTNVIPVFGPFLGAIPVILLLLMIHPMSAIVFAVFILILQQIDGNVLKPLILGDKLGINGFWILFSVTVGGSLFGVAGMFLGVPIFALIYEGIQDLVDIRLAEKDMKIPEESGVITARSVQKADTPAARPKPSAETPAHTD